MRAARRVFWNTAILFGAEVARLFSGLLLTVVIARRLGSADLGRFTYMTVLVGILGVVGDLGLSAFYIREAQRGPGRRLEAVVLGARIMGGVLVSVGLAVYAVLVEEHVLRLLLAAGSLLLMLGIMPAFITSVLRARQLMAYEAMARIVSSLATTLGGIAAIAVGWGIIGVAGVTVVGALASLGVLLRLGFRYVARPLVLRQPLTIYVETLRHAWPFALLAILVVIYFRIDSLLLFHMRGHAALGQYGAAYRLMEVGLLIPLTLAGAALPAVAKSLAGQTEDVMRLSVRAIHFLWIIAIPAAMLGALFAPGIISILYGRGFMEAAGIFRVLAFTLIPVFASAVTSSLIMASSRPAVNTYIAAVMVVVNIGLNLALIPRLSGLGAAVATVATESTGLVLGTVYIQRFIAPLPYARELVKPALASVAAGLPVAFSTSLALLPVCVGVYLVCLWALQGLTHEDIAFVRQLLTSPRTALLPAEPG